MSTLKLHWSHKSSVLRLIFKEVVQCIQKAQLLMVASSLAYTTILSLIPLLAVSFSIFQAFGGIEKLYQTIEPFILENLAEGASEEAMTLIRRFISNIHGGAIGIGGLIGLIITSMALLNSAEKAINQVWDAKVERSWFQRISSYWMFITLGPVALSIALGAATSAELPLQRFLPSGGGIFFITVILFFLMYRFVPNRKVHIWPALISALMTATGWNLARWSYSLYTRYFVSYSQIYGSLAAVPILLLWIYIAWVILLTGAALTVALQKQMGTHYVANQ